MTRLTHSLLAKVVAVFLIVIFGAIAVTSLIGTVYCYQQNLYDSNSDTYYNTYACYNTTIANAYMVAEYVQYDYEGLDYIFSQNTSNFGYKASYQDAPDVVVAQNFVPDKIGFQTELTAFNINVQCYVSDPISVYDNYYPSYELYNFIYPLRNIVVVIFIFSTLLFVADLVFLTYAAGRHKDFDGVKLNVIDRIPLDLYLVLCVFLFCLLPVIAFDFMYFNVVSILAMLLAIAVDTLILLSVVLTLATRIKLGKVWKNTVIYHFSRPLKSFFLRAYLFIRRAVHSISLIWRSIISFVVISLLGLILIMLGIFQYAPGVIVVILLADIILLVAVCMIAMNLRDLQKGGRALAAGDFDYKVNTAQLHWEFKDHGKNLNSIGAGMLIAVEQRMKSERLKTELITNVSHDIKTPLTSIINYVDLLKKDPTPEETKTYLEVLDRQSKRLKKLTEDLVEASKASTGNLPVSMIKTDVGELVHQAVGEYSERLLASKLDPVISVPDDGAFIMADGRLLWRVIDNLLNNACKYSQPNTRLYMDIYKEEDSVIMSFKNISRDRLNMSSDELMERFVRGDSSRSTEGSGLGLNIAKSLITLQGGDLDLHIDGDLFKAEIRFDAAED